MTIWFVSRHPGAIEWACDQGLKVDRWQPHLDVAEVMAGDIVIGSLPANLAACVCARGAIYMHLTLALPAHLRGCELTAQQLRELGARLTQLQVDVVSPESGKKG